MTKKAFVSYAAAISATALGMVHELSNHGDIAFANETRFSEAYFSQPLTDFAVGWKDTADNDAALNFLTPPVKVPRKFTYKEWINVEQFLSDTDDERSIGSDFKQVDFTSKKTLGQTVNRGLTMRVDLDQVAETDGWREIYTQMLLARCKRNEWRRGITLASAAAVNTAKTWDTTALKDPDQDIRTELITASDLSGLRPNRILFGDTSWDKRGISFRAQNNAGGYASAGLSPEQLASQLNVDGVMVNRSRYASSATARTQIVNNLVIMFLSQDGPTVDDPTNFKRFWTPCDGGSPWRVYEQQINSKLFDITVEYYSVIKATSTLAVRQFTVS